MTSNDDEKIYCVCVEVEDLDGGDFASRTDEVGNGSEEIQENERNQIERNLAVDSRLDLCPKNRFPFEW